MRILDADLTGWTDADLRAALDVEVAALNRRLALGTVSDRQVGDMLYRRARCETLGNEIRRRKGLPPLPETW